MSKTPKITATRSTDAKGVATITVTGKSIETWTTSGKRAAAATSVIVAGNVLDADGNVPDDLTASDKLGVVGTRSDKARAEADAATMAKLNKYGRRYDNVTVVPVVEAISTADRLAALDKAKKAKTPKATTTTTKKATKPTTKRVLTPVPATENKGGQSVGNRVRGTGSIFHRNTGKRPFLCTISIDGKRVRNLTATLDEAHAWLDEMSAAKSAA